MFGYLVISKYYQPHICFSIIISFIAIWKDILFMSLLVGDSFHHLNIFFQFKRIRTFLWAAFQILTLFFKPHADAILVCIILL